MFDGIRLLYDEGIRATSSPSRSYRIALVAAQEPIVAVRMFMTVVGVIVHT
jgi:hypothetical protein